MTTHFKSTRRSYESTAALEGSKCRTSCMWFSKRSTHSKLTSLVPRAEAQASTRAPVASTSTRRGRSWDRSMMTTTSFMASSAFRARPRNTFSEYNAPGAGTAPTRAQSRSAITSSERRRGSILTPITWPTALPRSSVQEFHELERSRRRDRRQPGHLRGQRQPRRRDCRILGRR